MSDSPKLGDLVMSYLGLGNEDQQSRVRESAERKTMAILVKERAANLSQVSVMFIVDFLSRANPDFMEGYEAIVEYWSKSSHEKACEHDAESWDHNDDGISGRAAMPVLGFKTKDEALAWSAEMSAKANEIVKRMFLDMPSSQGDESRKASPWLKVIKGGKCDGEENQEE